MCWEDVGLCSTWRPPDWVGLVGWIVVQRVLMGPCVDGGLRLGGIVDAF